MAAIAAGALRWRTRADKHRSEKKRAAAKLKPFLPETGCIYLDGSTTIYHVVEALHQHAGLRVVTNNIDTFQAVAACPGCEAVLVGGRLNRTTDNLTGPLARAGIEKFNFDAAFFSAYAIDAERGPSEPSLEDAEVKDLVCARADQHFLAVNTQKLNQRAAGVWALPTSAQLVTDLVPADERLHAYRALFHDIH